MQISKSLFYFLVLGVFVFLFKTHNKPVPIDVGHFSGMCDKIRAILEYNLHCLVTQPEDHTFAGLMIPYNICGKGIFRGLPELKGLLFHPQSGIHLGLFIFFHFEQLSMEMSQNLKLLRFLLLHLFLTPNRWFTGQRLQIRVIG